jgi:hypothetical protein
MLSDRKKRKCARFAVSRFVAIEPFDENFRTRLSASRNISCDIGCESEERSSRSGTSPVAEVRRR